jgi:hypothetical protein
MIYGMVVDIDILNPLMDELEAFDVGYLFHDCNQVISGESKIEMDFDTEENRDKASAIIGKLREQK